MLLQALEEIQDLGLDGDVERGDGLIADEHLRAHGRGRQSAALYVVRHRGGYLGANDVLVDLRVDDAQQPVQELQRLLSLHRLFLGTGAAQDRIAIDAALLRELQAIMARHSHYRGAVTGSWDDATEHALMEFFGMENLEERVDLKAHTIDAPALAFVRKTFGGGS